MDKKCSKCGVVKNINEFRLNIISRDGHQSQCKECKKGPAKEYREKTREQTLVYQKEYRQSHKKSIFEHMQEYRIKHRKEISDHTREYRSTENGKNIQKKIDKEQREKYPEKNKARHAVNHAIEHGEFPKIKTLTCSVCNSRQAEHYHHHNGYDKSCWLDVIPVCIQCHKDIHNDL